MESQEIGRIAAWIATAGFAGMFFFQLALALGAPLGRLAWGGRFDRLPVGYRIGSLLSAGIFVFAAICVLERAGILVVLGAPYFVSVAVWILAGLFALSALGNAASKSPAEKRVMTPIALLLSLCCFVVALSA